MPRPCSVCSHPQRAEIDRQIMTAGATLAALVRDYRVSRHALSRHSAHIAHTPPGRNSTGALPLEQEENKMLEGGRAETSTRVCPTCSKPFFPSKPHHQFCSHACFKASRRGELSPKEQRFVSAFLHSGDPLQAASMIGITQAQIRQGAMEIATRPHVRAAIQAALEAQGLTLDQAAQTLREGVLGAEKMVLGKDGEPVSLGPDHGTRHRYLQTELELMGARDKQLAYREEEASVRYEDILAEIEAAEAAGLIPPLGALPAEAEWEEEPPEDEEERALS